MRCERAADCGCATVVSSVISPSKPEIVEHFRSGARHGVDIAYICQDAPTGMADAVDATYPWISDHRVIMGMPDTVFQPLDAVLDLKQLFEREGPDLVLGVFPTDEG